VDEKEASTRGLQDLGLSLSRPSVVCAGIVVADLFVPPLPSLPAAGELRVTGDFLLAPGGCAANTAIVLSRLGVDAPVAGKVGEDLFGDFLEEDLSRRGSTPAVWAVRRLTRRRRRSRLRWSARTGVSSTRWVRTPTSESPTSTDLLSRTPTRYVGGFFVLPGLDGRALGDLYASARAAGVRTILDVVVPSDDEGVSLDLLADVLPQVDLFIPNEDEARALTGMAEPESQAKQLREAGATAVVVTMGAEGSVFVDDEHSLHVEAPKVEVVDGSGAGDAYTAGLIAGHLQGWDVERGLRFASVLGASACTKLGCTAGVFDRSEAERFLDEHALTSRPGAN
jgi:sugar/nucleoside kinase (ribokinase family)